MSWLPARLRPACDGAEVRRGLCRDLNVRDGGRRNDPDGGAGAERYVDVCGSPERRRRDRCTDRDYRFQRRSSGWRTEAMVQSCLVGADTLRRRMVTLEMLLAKLLLFKYNSSLLPV